MSAARARDAGSGTPMGFRDPHFQTMSVRIGPGEHYVTDRKDVIVVTVLGSCVAACIRDPLAGVGGMNHFMLADSGDSAKADAASMRYGNVAMERLINDILVRGGRRGRLEIKVFGGGNMFSGGGLVGQRNADYVEEYLRREDLAIVARHLRGDHARRVHYCPVSGRVRMLKMRSMSTVVAEEENSYTQRLRGAEVAGTIELFD